MNCLYTYFMSIKAKIVDPYNIGEKDTLAGNMEHTDINLGVPEYLNH